MAAEARPVKEDVYLDELRAYIFEGLSLSRNTILYLGKHPKPVEFIRELGANGLSITKSDEAKIDRYRKICRFAEMVQSKREPFYNEEDYRPEVRSEEEIEEMDEYKEETLPPNAGPLSADLHGTDPFKETRDLDSH